METVVFSLLTLFVAVLGFVGGHFLFSFPPIRSRLVAKLGERGFLGFYSGFMALFLVLTILAYRNAPIVWLWHFGIPGRWVAVLVMPIALIVAVLGLTTRNVTAVGGDQKTPSAHSVTGIVTITRHPFLWGATLWAVAHLFANGDVAALILFGDIAVLSLGGMIAIDHKRALKLGENWEPIVRTTSAVPFVAALSGRTRIDWAGIGWVRPLVALALYVALLDSHRLLFGVSALPSGQ